MEWCHFAPVNFAPQCHFAPTYHASFCPRDYVRRKTHYINYDIARCAIKWCENENKRYTIIYNRMQRFYYLICQRNWCQNASRFIYQKGEISFLWDTQNVVYGLQVWFRCVTLNHVDVKIDSRQTCFFSKHPVFHFAPTYYIWFTWKCPIILISYWPKKYWKS